MSKKVGWTIDGMEWAWAGERSPVPTGTSVSPPVTSLLRWNCVLCILSKLYFWVSALISETSSGNSAGVKYHYHHNYYYGCCCCLLFTPVRPMATTPLPATCKHRNRKRSEHASRTRRRKHATKGHTERSPWDQRQSVNWRRRAPFQSTDIKLHSAWQTNRTHSQD